MGHSNQNNNFGFICIPRNSGISSIAVSLLALSFHLLIIKILLKDIGTLLSHHKIVLALTISDALQVSSALIVNLIALVLPSTTKSNTCRLLRDTLVFTASITVTVSSFALITFAIERMVICMHFLQYRRLFRRTRVTRLLRSYWIVGIIMGAIATATNNARTTETPVSESTSFQIICSLVILPSAVMITTIYFRIFLISRQIIMRVTPNVAGSNPRRTSPFKRRQLRIASVAGVVCMSYLLCTVPMAVIFFLELTSAIGNHPSVKKILVSIAMVNTLADPIVYGFGICHARQIVIRMVNRIFPCEICG